MISGWSQNLPRHGRTWEKPFHKQRLVTVVDINHGTVTQLCLFLKASPRLSIQQTCQIPREVSFAALGSQGKHSCLKCFMVTDDTSVLLWEITWCRQELRVEEIKITWGLQAMTLWKHEKTNAIVGEPHEESREAGWARSLGPPIP